MPYAIADVLLELVLHAKPRCMDAMREMNFASTHVARSRHA